MDSTLDLNHLLGLSMTYLAGRDILLIDNRSNKDGTLSMIFECNRRLNDMTITIWEQ